MTKQAREGMTMGESMQRMVESQADTVEQSLTLAGAARSLIDCNGDGDVFYRNTIEDGEIVGETFIIEDEEVDAEEVFDYFGKSADTAWLEDALDVTVRGSKSLDDGDWEVDSIDVLQSVGGPNVWITFYPDNSPEVNVHWGSNSARRVATDEIQVGQYLFEQAAQ